jgi:hypothetical protein
MQPAIRFCPDCAPAIMAVLPQARSVMPIVAPALKAPKVIKAAQ